MRSTPETTELTATDGAEPTATDGAEPATEAAPPTATYDEAYYATYESPYEQSPQWMALFHHFADRIVGVLNPTSVLDAGCALGLLVQTLRQRGVEAYGIDISEYAIAHVDPSVAEYCRVATLTETLEDRYDLITCIEVIEHLPADEAEVAIANLCSATDRVLLSSTPSGYEEPTHLNVQPPEYWTALFARHGFFRNLDLDTSFISPWAVLFERQREDLPERVRAYDRSFWRQRDEILRLRTALLEASAAESAGAPEPAEPVDPNPEFVARIEQLEADLLTERHNRLRSIDEAESATARMGAALGRIAELEAEIARLTSLGDRHNDVVNSTTWRMMWRVMAPYRQARTRLGR